MNGGVEDIRDLKPWIPLSTVPLWVVLVALAVAAAAAYWLWRRSRKAKPVAAEVVPPAPPGPSPLERLVKLKQAGLEGPEAIRLYHFDLSESFRAAIEERYRYPATDRTTEELKRGLRGVVSELGRVVAVLEATDLVKFTDYRPEPAASRELLKDALSIVESWRPDPVSPGSPQQFAREVSP